MDVDLVLDRMHAELVGRADDLAPLHAAAGQPHREAVRVVIAAVTLLAHRRSTEFAPPDDECFVEQSPLLQVPQKGGHRLVGLAAMQAVVLFNLAVGVPLAARARVQLHEPDTPLHESPGEQTVLSESLRPLVAQTVGLLSLPRLTRQIDSLGCLGLHPEGEFKRCDPRLEVGVTGTKGQVFAVELIDEVQLGQLPLVADSFGVVEIQNRALARQELGSLMRRRHEAGTPDAVATGGLAIAVEHDDETGQIPVLGAQAVIDPRPQTRPAGQDAAGVHLADPTHMVQGIGRTRANHAQVVRTFTDMRIPVRHRQPARTVLLPFSLGRQQRVFGNSHRCDHPLDRRGERLARHFVDQRLRVERVEMAGTTVHEQEDDVAGLAKKVRTPRRDLGGGSTRLLLRHQAGKRESAEPTARMQQEVAARRDQVLVRLN